ncbi:hypothetical protein Ahu01nite_098150 [Winogradskya humida]|uniref:Uncharacterized protein n=1 Tax=Winogradskya humida TaxID=113566 RepID=A0ABQ4A7D1_9ACTN|nr:hypothetical protein Ahu01nite_098150 [Actinoplanes humidus]
MGARERPPAPQVSAVPSTVGGRLYCGPRERGYGRVAASPPKVVLIFAGHAAAPCYQQGAVVAFASLTACRGKGFSIVLTCDQTAEYHSRAVQNCTPSAPEMSDAPDTSDRPYALKHTRDVARIAHNRTTFVRACDLVRGAM